MTQGAYGTVTTGHSAVLRGPPLQNERDNGFLSRKRCALFQFLEATVWLAALGSHAHFLAREGWAGTVTDSSACS